MFIYITWNKGRTTLTHALEGPHGVLVLIYHFKKYLKPLFFFFFKGTLNLRFGELENLKIRFLMSRTGHDLCALVHTFNENLTDFSKPHYCPIECGFKVFDKRKRLCENYVHIKVPILKECHSVDSIKRTVHLTFQKYWLLRVHAVYWKLSRQIFFSYCLY